MVTVLNEDAPEGEEKLSEDKNMPNFEQIFKQAFGEGMGPMGRGPFGGPRGPHGPHRHGPHGHGPHGHGPHGGPGGRFKKMMGAFMEQMGMDQTQIDKATEQFDQFKKDFKAQNAEQFKGWGGCKGDKPWKLKRAQIIEMPREELQVYPGQLLNVIVEVRNGT
jgi:hypothetical protein